MNANDLYDWKRHPVTQAVFSQLTERIVFMTEALVSNAGADPLQDAKYSAAIQAHRDVLGIEYEDVKQETETQ